MCIVKHTLDQVFFGELQLCFVNHARDFHLMFWLYRKVVCYFLAGKFSPTEDLNTKITLQVSFMKVYSLKLSSTWIRCDFFFSFESWKDTSCLNKVTVH